MGRESDAPQRARAPGEIVAATTEPAVAVVELHGEHDLASAPALARRLRLLVAGHSLVAVDISRVTFMDSAIMAVLWSAYREARRRGRRVAGADGAVGDLERPAEDRRAG